MILSPLGVGYPGDLSMGHEFLVVFDVRVRPASADGLTSKIDACCQRVFFEENLQAFVSLFSILITCFVISTFCVGEGKLHHESQSSSQSSIVAKHPRLVTIPTRSNQTIMKIVSAIVASLLASSALAFAPAPTTRVSSTALNYSVKKDEDFRKAVSSVFAAAFVALNIAAVPAFAVDETMDFGSSQVVAARSGGRSGGRVSSGGNSQAYRSSSSSSRNTYKSYSSTTIIAPPPSPTVYVAPSYSMGYSYNPLGDLATGYALGSVGSAIGNIGNAMQDARQEQEIQRSRQELEQARMKEAELEGRLRALEQQQSR